MTIIAILFWTLVFSAGASALYVTLRDDRSRMAPPASRRVDADFLPPARLR